MMSQNPYFERLRELTPVIETALEAEFPERSIKVRTDQPPTTFLRTLDPFAAHLVLIGKMGALFPAVAACCLIGLMGQAGGPLPPIAGLIVLFLTMCAYLAMSGVARLESTAGLWKRPRRGEPDSISSLRFMGLQFYPARISSQA